MRFRAQTIDDQIQIGYGVTVADVDGDGRPDILVADKRHFAWYRNPTWEKFILTENLTERDNVCIAAADIDGDGKCEIAVGADWDPNDRENSGAVFYLVPPEDRTQRWTAVKLPAEPTVHRMRWLNFGNGNWGLVVVPLHGRTGKPARALVYHVPSDPRGQWLTEVIDESMTLTHNFDVLGWGSVLLAGHEGLMAATRTPAGWTRTWVVRGNVEHPLESIVEPEPGFRGAGEVRVGRLGRRDFVVTVEPMHGNELVVYIDAKRHVLADDLREGHALACGDLLGVGSDQIVAGWRGRGPGTSIGIAVFTALDEHGDEWRRTSIDDAMACEDLWLADLDGDGRAEIIAAGRATRNLKIYWNEGR